MSFKLFTLQTFGKLKATDKIETERKSLYSDYQEFLAVEKSGELKNYLERESWLSSDEFNEQKCTNYRMKSQFFTVIWGNIFFLIICTCLPEYLLYSAQHTDCLHILNTCVNVSPRVHTCEYVKTKIYT